MNRTTLYAIVGGVVLLLAGLVFYTLQSDDDAALDQFRDLANNPPAAREVDMSVLEGLQFQSTGEGGMMPLGELTFDQIVALLRRDYGKNIANRAVQVDMLEELIRQLQRQYPDNWVAKLQEILYAAFPELAGDLFRLSQNLYEFNRKVEAERDKINAMNADDRRAYLWDLRNSIFGEDAAGEIWANERKREQLSAQLRTLAQNKDLSVSQKAESFREAIDEAYGPQANRLLENRRPELTNLFFDQVQTDLAAMAPEERRETYRVIWKEMGYDSSAVERLDQLETTRDERWSNGAIYETRRKEIASAYSGAEREEKLATLRKELLGEEADTVRAEEESGFYRFQRTRRYGRD